MIFVLLLELMLLVELYLGSARLIPWGAGQHVAEMVGACHTWWLGADGFVSSRSAIVKLIELVGLVHAWARVRACVLSGGRTLSFHHPTPNTTPTCRRGKIPKPFA